MIRLPFTVHRSPGVYLFPVAEARLVVHGLRTVNGEQQTVSGFARGEA